MSDVRKLEILAAIENAASVRIVKFLGEVLRVHKIHDLEHTRDEQFMEMCRDSYHSRLQQLEGDGDARLRQQPEGRTIQEQEEGDGQPSRLHGERGSGQQGVLCLGLGEEVEEGDELHVPDFHTQG